MEVKAGNSALTQPHRFIRINGPALTGPDRSVSMIYVIALLVVTIVVTAVALYLEPKVGE
jgi:hypothetical protein